MWDFPHYNGFLFTPVVFILCNYYPGNPGTPLRILGIIPYGYEVSQFYWRVPLQLYMLKQLLGGCVVQFTFNFTLCEYFKDLPGKYIKGNDDVLSLFLLQLLGTQIGLNWVG